jgi:DNA-binding CsgD family transcriptional regulator/tetratricopeptide (TPR) repeat protein
MIGRASELAQLNTLLADAKKGKGSTLIVSGEGGIGKTRLLTAATEKAAKSGWNVVMGRSYAVETGIPYALFSDAFLPLLQTFDSSTLNVLTRGGSAELSMLFPVLGNADSRGRLAAGAEASELKARLLWNFTQFVGRLSLKQPICIVLENLQWSDASSLELFHFLSRNVATNPIAILASYNETERDLNQFLRTTEQSLLNLGVAGQLKLGPLSQTEVFDLITTSYDGDTRAMRQFSALLYGWTRGNPFFIEETMKELIASGVLRNDNGRWTGWEVESLNLPSTVRDAVVARIGRLSRDARELADIASVVGTPMTFGQLANLSGLDEAALAAAMDELSSQRILVEERGTGDTTYPFAHPMVQQVLYSALGSGRTRLLHSRVADSLEHFYGGRSDAHAGELAFHFSRSGAQGIKAVRYLTRAGRNALDTYANREAASFLSSALKQTEQLQQTVATRSEILRDLARALQRLGKYDEALTLWSQARDAAIASGDNEARAAIEYRMGLAHYWSGRFDRALEHYDDGIGAAGSDDSSVIRLHLAKAICLQELAQLDAAKTEMQSALAVAEANGDPSLLSRCHRALLMLHTWTGPRETAVEHSRKAIEFAERSGEKMLEWQTNLAAAVHSGLSSNPADTTRQLNRCAELENELRSPLLPMWSAEVSLLYSSWTGKWDEALAIGERAIASALTYSQNTLVPRMLVWTGLIYLSRHELDRARLYFDDAWHRSGADRVTGHRIDVQSVIPAHIGRAAYQLEIGNYSEAIRIGEEGADLADRLGYVAWTLHWILPVIGEAALWMRDFPRAEACLARIRRDAERLSSPVGAALADACEGMLYLLRDENVGEAIGYLRSAINKLDAIPMPDLASRVRRAIAQAFRDYGDRDTAISELRLAHDALSELGAHGQLEKVRHEMRGLGARPPAKASGKGIGALTGRELEIAQMVAQRKTNKQIGAALDISSRTVSTHLTNIFGKTGVGSRAELGDYVREQFSVT